MAKEMKIKKKMDLKKIIEKDQSAKKEAKDHGSKMENRTSDFGENNVLSYIYEKKEHKSVAMGQKKEYLINLMEN